MRISVVCTFFSHVNFYLYIIKVLTWLWEQGQRPKKHTSPIQKCNPIVTTNLLAPLFGIHSESPSHTVNVFSIAFFNFAGVSVTKELSATTRMVLDSIRTLVVWIFSLVFKWEHFQYLQVSVGKAGLFVHINVYFYQTRMLLYRLAVAE